MTGFSLLQGVKLARCGEAADGKVVVPADQALAGKVVALYFSAHWCECCVVA